MNKTEMFVTQPRGKITSCYFVSLQGYKAHINSHPLIICW